MVEDEMKELQDRFMQEKKLSKVVEMALDDLEAETVNGDLCASMDTWVGFPEVSCDWHDDGSGPYEPCSVCLAGAVAVNRGFIGDDMDSWAFVEQNGFGNAVAPTVLYRLRSINDVRMGHIYSAVRDWYSEVWRKLGKGGENEVREFCLRLAKRMCVEGNLFKDSTDAHLSSDETRRGLAFWRKFVVRGLARIERKLEREIG